MSEDRLDALLERIDLRQNEVIQRLVRIESQQSHMHDRLKEIEAFFQESPEVQSMPTRVMLLERAIIKSQDGLSRLEGNKSQITVVSTQGRWAVYVAVVAAVGSLAAAIAAILLK